LPRQLLNGIQKDPLAWHRAFIEGFVIPHGHCLVIFRLSAKSPSGFR
jgi:hypothetical protein